MKFVILAVLAQIFAPAQDAVVIRVDAAARQGPLKPITSYFGYDEPNYTYMKYGAKLVGELAGSALFRSISATHHLLCTGDGTPRPEWGSTNAYTEDSSGKPIYDWTIVDRIFDTYVHAAPSHLSKSASCRKRSPLSLNRTPPNGARTRQRHGLVLSAQGLREVGRARLPVGAALRQRYGKQETLTWYWELWNEPNISYWRGTPDEYLRLYDFTSDAVKRALPGARIGGPATTDPTSPKAAAFLQQFLEHCARGQNAATRQTGAPLDFITYHAKGSPKVVAGHVQMGLSRNLQNVAKGFEIVASFPQFRKLPIILSEYDPEGCAACSARDYPQNAYRNGTLYPTYTAASIKNIILLAERYGTNIEGMLTWAFEFEGQPYFAGFRTLATNGIDKPVLNVFRMAGMMRGDLVKVTSSGAVALDDILESGVREKPSVNALAARSDREISVMAWNYHDDDLPAPDAPVRMMVAGLPDGVARVQVRHFRIDRGHSNAYTVWQQMGSPQEPSAEQYARLEAAGRLALLEPPRSISAKRNSVDLQFALPRHAVSLVQVRW